MEFGQEGSHTGLDRLGVPYQFAFQRIGEADLNMGASHEYELAYAREYQAFLTVLGIRGIKQSENDDHMLQLNKLFQIALSTMLLEARFILSARSALY